MAEKDFVSSITADGYRAAVGNTPSANGFRVELAHADVYKSGQKKGRFALTGTVIGDKQVRVRAAITTQTGEYFYDEVRLIDGVSGNEFALMRREDGSDIDFVSPFKTSFFQCDITFATLDNQTVTVISASDEINALWAELDTRGKVKWAQIADIPDATTEQKGVVQLAGEVSDSADKALTPKAAQTALQQACPPGQVAFFAGRNAPQGWLKADGAAVSRTLYANLFAAIGTTYGTGDGLTTFNLPDLRGEFVRGYDESGTVDKGRVLGSKQGSAVGEHSHPVGNITGNNDDAAFIRGNWSGNNQYQTQQINGEANRNVSHQRADGNLITGGVVIANQTGDTRPRNIALLACIKT